MKNLITYINESRTGDFFMTIAECIKDPKHITDADIKKIVSTLKSVYNMELKNDEAKSLANTVATDWPELFENK